MNPKLRKRQVREKENGDYENELGQNKTFFGS